MEIDTDEDTDTDPDKKKSCTELDPSTDIEINGDYP
jgi:hypothetical protein